MSSAELALQHWFVAVGASGAGFKDLERLLCELPYLPNATVLVVLHRQSDAPSILAEVLNYRASMPVLIAVDGQRFEPGVCYVGAPADHLALASRSKVQLVPDQFRDQHRNRTVDLLFASVAQHVPGRAIGVILSGTLDDGSRGLAQIHDAGGLTMVVTPVSGRPGDMPRNAIGYDGPIDFVGSITDIAASIARVVQAGSPT